MSGGGHMAALLKRTKENEARRRALREKKRFDSKKIKDGRLQIEEFDFVKLPEEELQKVKQKHLEKIKKERKRTLIKTFLISVIIVSLIALFLFYS